MEEMERMVEEEMKTKKVKSVQPNMDRSDKKTQKKPNVKNDEL